MSFDPALSEPPAFTCPTPDGSGRTTRPGPLTLRVLCVDDNQDSADSMGTLLRLYGAEVAVCHDGPSALAAAAAFDPDACVLDITMPGMDGCELARRLREQAGDRPILLAAVTALDGYRECEREVDAGFDLHFTKPVEPAELVEALSDFIREREAARTG